MPTAVTFGHGSPFCPAFFQPGAAADALHPLTHCRGWRRACANVGRQVGYQSHSLTEVSNRTQDNALDVRQALVQCGTNLSDLQV